MPAPESVERIVASARRRLTASGLIRRVVGWTGAAAALLAGLAGAARHWIIEWADQAIVICLAVALVAAVAGGHARREVGVDRAGARAREVREAGLAVQAARSPEAVGRMIDQVCIPDSPESLTPREVDVLRLLARAMSNKEIGHTLGITEKTVKTHVSSILSKLNMPSRTQAALYAVRVGLVSLDEPTRGM